MDNVIDEEEWQRLLPRLRERCPRLTPADLEAAERRVDLLTAKIQFRHWIDRVSARRIVLGLREELRREGVR